MNKLFDKLWVKIDDILCNDVTFEKKDIYMMKDLDTCFITAEIDFYTKETLSNNNIIDIHIPALDYDFPPCENTTFAIRDNNTNTFIKVKISQLKLRLECFPFLPSSHYELNIQFFFMLRNPKTYSIALNSL